MHPCPLWPPALLSLSGSWWSRVWRHAALMVLASVVIGVRLCHSLKAVSRPDWSLFRMTWWSTRRVFSGHTMLSAMAHLALGVLLCRTQASVAVKTYILCFAGPLTAIVGVTRPVVPRQCPFAKPIHIALYMDSA